MTVPPFLRGSDLEQPSAKLCLELAQRLLRSLLDSTGAIPMPPYD